MFYGLAIPPQNKPAVKVPRGINKLSKIVALLTAKKSCACIYLCYQKK
jgi:hypothetical protein